jgi:hypothetical protein
VPNFICPNCQERSVDIDARKACSTRHRLPPTAGSAFLFELMDDYYPAPTTAGHVRPGRPHPRDRRGIFELSGWSESDVLATTWSTLFGLTGFEEEKNRSQLSLEWGVRRLNEQLQLRTSGRPGQARRRRLLPRARRRRRPARRPHARRSARFPHGATAPGVIGAAGALTPSARESCQSPLGRRLPLGRGDPARTGALGTMGRWIRSAVGTFS